MSFFTKSYHKSSYPAIDPSLPAVDQSGRTVLITGGATGIGFSIAQSFVAASAARVIIASRSQANLNKAKAELQAYAKQSSTPTVVETLSLDLASKESIDALWKTLKENKTDVDILVHNAALFPDMSVKLTDPTAYSTIKHMYDVNVVGSWQLAIEFIAQGPKQGKVLINISTANIHFNPMINSVYGTMKAAFTHQIQAIADEYSPDQVQIINVHPGAVYTDAAEKAGFDADTLPWDTVDLPGQATVWVASKEAAFLHGRFFWVNWDVDEIKSMKKRVEEDPSFLRLSLVGTENLHPSRFFGSQS